MEHKKLYFGREDCLVSDQELIIDIQAPNDVWSMMHPLFDHSNFLGRENLPEYDLSIIMTTETLSLLAQYGQTGVRPDEEGPEQLETVDSPILRYLQPLLVFRGGDLPYPDDSLIRA